MLEVEVATGFVRVKAAGRSLRAAGLGCNALLADPDAFAADLREAAKALGAEGERAAAFHVADSRCVVQAFTLRAVPARLRREAALAQLSTLVPDGALGRFHMVLHWQAGRSVVACGMPKELVAALRKVAGHWRRVSVEPASLPLVRGTGLADGVFFAFAAGECTEWVIANGRVQTVSVQGAMAPASLRLMVNAARRELPDLEIRSLNAPPETLLDGVAPWDRRTKPAAVPRADFGPPPRGRIVLMQGVRVAVPVVFVAALAAAPLQAAAWHRTEARWAAAEQTWRAAVKALQARERQSQAVMIALGDLATPAELNAIPWAQGTALLERTHGSGISLQSLTAVPVKPGKAGKSRGFVWTVHGTAATTADLLAWQGALVRAGWVSPVFGPVNVQQQQIVFTLNVVQPAVGGGGGGV